MKLYVKGYVSDMGYMDTWNDEYDVDVDEGSSILEVVIEFFKTERDHTDDEIEDFLKMVESGKWCGGRWTKVSETQLEYDTDVMEEEFSI